MGAYGGCSPAPPQTRGAARLRAGSALTSEGKECSDGVADMNGGFDALLRRELASGFDTLHGLQLSGDIPLREALLNTLVRELPHSPRDARVEIAAGNRITLRAGVF